MVWKGDANRRLAKSLITLIDQVDAKWPSRDKSSDGSIGDAAHAARASDHNPNAAGVVTALDLDRDIAAGFNARNLAQSLVASRDLRIKYIISNGQIISSKVSPWVWRPYDGENAHREHIHISVDADPALYDDARPWAITGAAQPTGVRMRFTGITATVFGGPGDNIAGGNPAYGATGAWWDRPGVALPARINTRPLPKVIVSHNGRSVVCDIVDVGPWNDSPGDPYWETGTRPKAEQGLRDDHGRIPTNKAGIDLTPAAANAIGLQGKGLVDWDFVDAITQLPPPTGQTMPPPETAVPYNANIEDCLIEIAKAQRPILERYLKAGAPMMDEEKRRLVIMALGGTPPPSSPVLITGPSVTVPPAAGSATTAEPVPAPASSPTTVNISAALAGVLASLGLSATGVIGAPVGPDATTTGMLLPLLSMGAGALGIPAPIVSIIGTLFSRMFAKP